MELAEISALQMLMRQLLNSFLAPDSQRDNSRDITEIVVVSSLWNDTVFWSLQKPMTFYHLPLMHLLNSGFSTISNSFVQDVIKQLSLWRAVWLNHSIGEHQVFSPDGFPMGSLVEMKLALGTEKWRKATQGKWWLDICVHFISII